MSKKAFTNLAIIASMVIMGTFFIPFYQVVVGSGDTAYGYFDLPWRAFYRLEGNLFIASTVFFVLYLILMVGGITLYAISASAKDPESDREDKFFVFACFLCAITHAFYALMCIGIGSFIPMVLAILYAILYVVAILIHHRYLVEY